MLILSALLAAIPAPQPASAERERNAATCVALSQKANTTAMELHNLATCFFQGDGVAQDYGRARHLYERAAAQGFLRAECALGNMLVDGLGGARDIAGGLARCRRAAEAGEAQAQTDLANYLLMGEVVVRDVVEARRWYRSAAEQGQANAAFVLGQIYWNGDGVAKDDAEAARWWRVAHQGGRPDAAYLLAREAMVRVTSRGQQNIDYDALQQALAWFDLAARADPDAAHRSDAVDSARLLRQLQTFGHR